MKCYPSTVLYIVGCDDADECLIIQTTEFEKILLTLVGFRLLFLNVVYALPTIYSSPHSVSLSLFSVSHSLPMVCSQ